MCRRPSGGSHAQVVIPLRPGAPRGRHRLLVRVPVVRRGAVVSWRQIGSIHVPRGGFAEELSALSYRS
jgi:hypothetical protein